MALTVSAARARLERMLQWQQEPTLTSSEIDDLLAYAAMFDDDGVEPDTYTEWTASTVLAANAYRTPVVRNGYVYRVTVGGTTGANSPAWPTTINATVVDGSVTWRCHAAAPWTPTFNLRAAAAEGWSWKAGKVAASFDAEAGEAKAQRSQVFDMCMAQAKSYRTGNGMVSMHVGTTFYG